MTVAIAEDGFRVESRQSREDEEVLQRDRERERKGGEKMDLGLGVAKGEHVLQREREGG